MKLYVIQDQVTGKVFNWSGGNYEAFKATSRFGISTFRFLELAKVLNYRKHTRGIAFPLYKAQKILKELTCYYSSGRRYEVEGYARPQLHIKKLSQIRV